MASLQSCKKMHSVSSTSSRSDSGNSYGGCIFLQDCNGMPCVHDSKLYFDADMVIATGNMKRIGLASGLRVVQEWKSPGTDDTAYKV